MQCKKCPFKADVTQHPEAMKDEMWRHMREVHP